MQICASDTEDRFRRQRIETNDFLKIFCRVDFFFGRLVFGRMDFFRSKGVIFGGFFFGQMDFCRMDFGQLGCNPETAYLRDIELMVFSGLFQFVDVFRLQVSPTVTYFPRSTVTLTFFVF